MVSDENRTNLLQGAGFTVIRFTDAEVLTDMQNVIKRIEKEIDELPCVSSP